MDDLRDKEPVWKDMKEFDIPEAVGVTASGDYLVVIRDKLISMVNYLTWINQYVPGVIAEIETLKIKIEREHKRQHKIVQYYLAQKYDEMPKQHLRSTELMVAYIEGKMAVTILKESNDIISTYENELVLKNKEYNDFKYRRNVLKYGITSCQNIMNSILWELDGKRA